MIHNIDILKQEVKSNMDCYYIFTQREEDGIDFEFLCTTDNEYVLLDSFNDFAVVCEYDFNVALKEVGKYLDKKKLVVENIIGIG